MLAVLAASVPAAAVSYVDHPDFVFLDEGTWPTARLERLAQRYDEAFVRGWAWDHHPPVRRRAPDDHLRRILERIAAMSERRLGNPRISRQEAAELHVRLGYVYDRLGDDTSARLNWMESLDEDPDGPLAPEAAFALGVWTADPHEAVRWLTRIRDDPELGDQARLGLAWAAFHLGDDDGAVDLAHSLLGTELEAAARHDLVKFAAVRGDAAVAARIEDVCGPPWTEVPDCAPVLEAVADSARRQAEIWSFAPYTSWLYVANPSE
jgi:hypothetical protein